MIGMPKKTIFLPKPKEYQLEILNSPARIKVPVCGRRWGKTVLGMIAALIGHGPDRIFRGALMGATIWWLAKDYSSAGDVVWPDLKRACQHGWSHKSEVERTIWFEGGGSISVRSADKEDSLRGPGLDGLIFDEAAFSKERVWSEIVRPMLSDKQGWAMLATTPNGFNWVEQLYRLAMVTPGYAAWQRPSSDNPLMTPDELASAKREVGPRQYAQEYDAKFTTVEGAEWPSEYFGDHIWFQLWPKQLGLKVMALDPSKGKDAKQGDYSAIVTTAAANQKLFVDCDMARRPAEDIVLDSVRIYRDFKPHFFGIEGNSFQDLLCPMFDREFAMQGLLGARANPLYNYGLKKEVRIRRLGALLANDQLRFKQGDGCELLVQQLREFSQGDHDDGPDALEMCLQIIEGALTGGNEIAGNVLQGAFGNA
jgi:hypothetical protein